MYVGFYFESIHVNHKEQKANVAFYFWLRAEKDREDSVYQELKNINFINCIVDKLEIHEDIIKDNYYYLSGQIVGTIDFRADYKDYPFDSQKIPLVVEHLTLTKDQLLILPDYKSYDIELEKNKLWGISDFLNSKDMIIEKTQYEELERVYKTNFGDPRITEKKSTYSSLAYTIFIKRNYAPYVIKFLIPLMIILTLAYLVFFIPPLQLELAASLTVTSLIAAIAFQWTISDDLPEIGYLTKVDKIYFWGYFLIMVAMVQTIYTYKLEIAKKSDLAYKIEIIGRVLFPILFISGFLYFCFF